MNGWYDKYKFIYYITKFGTITVSKLILGIMNTSGGLFSKTNNEKSWTRGADAQKISNSSPEPLGTLFPEPLGTRL